MLQKLYKNKINIYPKKRLIGIYFLFKDSNLVYIGASINIIKRINMHIYGRSDKLKKDFDSFSYIECKSEKIVELEKKYIQKYDPIYNKGLQNCYKHRNNYK